MDMSKSEDGDFTTTDDLAERLIVPAKTVRHWRLTGTGPPAYKFGRHVRYKTADVDAWLEQRRDDEASE